MGVKVKPYKGKWGVFINHRGRRKLVVVDSEAAATLAMHKIGARLAEGNVVDLEARPRRLPKPEPAPKPLTFGDYAERWLAAVVRPGLKPNTVKHYEATLREHALPALAAVPLAEVTRGRVRDLLLAKREAGLKSNTLKAILSVLRACLFYAVEEEGLLPVNPAARMGKFARRKGEPTVRKDPFSRPELLALERKAAEEFRQGPSDWYVFLLLASRTGARLGEIAGWQWEDFDLDGRSALIRRTYSEGLAGSPKGNRERRVDLSRQVTAVVREYRTRKEAEAAFSGKPLSPWLFTTATGRPLESSHVHRHFWSKLLPAAKVRYRNFHQVRHTFGSLLQEQGEPLLYIKDALGHSSVDLTVDVYGTASPGQLRAAVDRLDDPAWTAKHPVQGQPDATPAQPGSPLEAQQAS